MILQELDPVMLLDARENPGELPVSCQVPVLAVGPLLEGAPFCTDSDELLKKV